MSYKISKTDNISQTQDKISISFHEPNNEGIKTKANFSQSKKDNLKSFISNIMHLLKNLMTIY